MRSLKFAAFKSAFTLAEVLITLGVIGVVAAMTIPTLITNITKKQLESQIKVAYASIQQAMRASIADGLGFDMSVQDGNDSSMAEWFNTYMAPYLKTEQVCINTAGCWHKKGIVKTLNGAAPTSDSNIGIGTNIITFVTAKGSYFNIDGFNANDMKNMFGINTNSSGLIFYFDANGDRKPNVIGKDIYIMAFTEDGLVPAGQGKTRQQVEQNCLTGNGYWCLSKLISDSWEIDDRVWKR